MGRDARSDALNPVAFRSPWWRGTWIISRSQDIVWLQGSVLAGLILLACFVAAPPLTSTNYHITQPAILLLLLWGVLMDGTHVWGTYARTYFAVDEASKAALPSYVSWWVILVGPAIALVDYAFFKPGPSIVGHAGALFGYFLVAAYLWAYYHLIRQHYGVMVLYNRKAGAASRGDLDKLFLWIGCAYPFARFSLSDAYYASGLPHVLPHAWFGTARLLLDIAFAGAMLVLAARWVAWQRAEPAPFGPKSTFLLIVVGFHILVFGMLDNLLVITACLTIFHNIQYHRIVWQYEAGKGRRPMGNVAVYLGVGLLFGAVWYGPRVVGVATANTDLLRNILIGAGWGVAFHHYIVDARIWRVRRRPDIAQTLDRGAG